MPVKLPSISSSKLLARLRIDVGRVRIEVAQHPLQGDVDVLVLVQVLALAQLLAGVGQQARSARPPSCSLTFLSLASMSSGPSPRCGGTGRGWPSDQVALVDFLDVVLLDDLGGLDDLAGELARRRLRCIFVPSRMVVAALARTCPGRSCRRPASGIPCAASLGLQPGHAARAASGPPRPLRRAPCLSLTSLASFSSRSLTLAATAGLCVSTKWLLRPPRTKCICSFSSSVLPCSRASSGIRLSRYSASSSTVTEPSGS